MSQINSNSNDKTQISIDRNEKNRTHDVALRYYQLLAHQAYPQGQPNENNLWYPNQDEQQTCCQTITLPSARFPYTLLEHCRTLEHLAHRYHVNEHLLRVMVKKIAIERRNARRWFEPVLCPNCHMEIREMSRFAGSLVLGTTNGFSENTLAALNSNEIQQSTTEEMKNLQRYRFIRFFFCQCDNSNYALVCTNEMYKYDRTKQKWIKRRGYEIKQANPTALSVPCPLCHGYMHAIKQHIGNIEGLQLYTMEMIANSIRFVCEHCKTGINTEGFVYRFFQTGAMMRFCHSINKWVPLSYHFVPIVHEDTRRNERIAYTEQQSLTERLAMHITTRTAIQAINKNGLLRELKPFKELIPTEEEVQTIAEQIEQSRTA